MAEVVKGFLEGVEGEDVELVENFGAVYAEGVGVTKAAGALDVFGEPLLVKEGIGVGGMGGAKLVEKILQALFVGGEGVSIGRAGWGRAWR